MKVIQFEHNLVIQQCIELVLQAKQSASVQSCFIPQIEKILTIIEVYPSHRHYSKVFTAFHCTHYEDLLPETKNIIYQMFDSIVNNLESYKIEESVHLVPELEDRVPNDGKWYHHWFKKIR